MQLFETAVLAFRYLVLAVVCMSLLGATGNAYGQEAQEKQSAPVQEEVKEEPQPEKAGSGYEVLFLPPGHLYSQYLADPRRVDFGFQVLHYLKTEIPDAGNDRFDLKTGGQFGLVRLHPEDREDRGWELSLEGGIHAQFDVDASLDNLGWDGWYSLLLSAAPTKHLSLKFGWQHDSSHVGDEYAQKTGRRRIGYTRQELAAGASWLFDSGLRTYAEYGYGKLLGNGELQKPGRVQAGLEWQSPKTPGGGHRGWYAAADLSAMQERDWRVDVALQTGYRIDTLGKNWRFGVNWYNGRPPIGEFFQQTERYLGLGVWVDL